MQDAAALAAVAAASAAVPVHLDAVQAAGWLPLDAASLGVDAISLAGHKLGAPKGIGVLAVRGRVPLEPLLHGGGQERGRRSGTEDVAGAVGFATALELAEAERAESSARVVGAARRASSRRCSPRCPSARLTGDPVHRLPGTASFTFAGTSGEAVLLELERRGVVSSSGSACAAGSDEPSHVLLAMGISAEVAQTRCASRSRTTQPRRLWTRVGRRAVGGIRRRPYNRAGEHPSAAVTVIVPGFDVAPYAAEALESLRGQTLRGLDRDPGRRRVDRCDRRPSSSRRGGRPAIPRRPPRRRARARRRPQHRARPGRDAASSGSSTPTTCSPRPRSSDSIGTLDETGSDFVARRVRAPAAGLAGRLRGRHRAAVGGRGDGTRAARHDDRRAPAGDGEHRRVVQGQPHGLLAPQRPALPRGQAVRGPDRRAADVRARAAVRHDPRRRRALARCAPTARRSRSARRSCRCCATTSRRCRAGIGVLDRAIMPPRRGARVAPRSSHGRPAARRDRP